MKNDVTHWQPFEAYAFFRLYFPIHTDSANQNVGEEF